MQREYLGERYNRRGQTTALPPPPHPDASPRPFRATLDHKCGKARSVVSNSPGGSAGGPTAADAAPVRQTASVLACTRVATHQSDERCRHQGMREPTELLVTATAPRMLTR